MASTLSSRSITVVLALAAAAAPAAAETNTVFNAAMDSITAEELYEHVQVLSDDVYEGRAAGSRGGRAAAQYLIKELQQTGLSPAGLNDDYTQSFGQDCRNILVVQPGQDPDLQDELIVVGAHYDHVGYGNRSNSFGPIGKIHNGADDNASGTAVLLETIEAFATSGLRTRRSILFVFWDGEERGLVGSRHWLANPTMPVEHVKLALTIDMVGRLRKGHLYLLGTRSGYGLRRLMSGPLPMTHNRPGKRDGSGPSLWLGFTWELDDNSDHWSFLERQVPSVLLHTGLHADYHRPSDDVEKINREGMREVSQYLLAVLIKAANEDHLPTFRSRATRETHAMRRELERPLEPASLANWPTDQPPPRLGISWREDQAEPGTVFLTRVVEGTPAKAADLQVHDRVLEVNGQNFSDASQFKALIFAALESGQPEMTLLTERRGHTQTVTLAMPSIGQGAGGQGSRSER
jgi:Peptidase family M28/PDZ domain